MNKGFELNYQMKKSDYFGLKHVELWKPHGEAKKKTLWTVVGIELMASALDLDFSWSDWARWPDGDGSGKSIMVVNSGKEEMKVALKCSATQHL